jgi:hypothetical protein
MSFAVSDENSAIRINENTVWSRHLALQRVAILTIASLASASNEFQFSRLCIHHADRVTLTVGQPDVTLGIKRDPFGSR